MGRTKGSKNKSELVRPTTSALTSEGRIQFLANLMIDRVLGDPGDPSKKAEAYDE